MLNTVFENGIGVVVEKMIFYDSFHPKSKSLVKRKLVSKCSCSQFNPSDTSDSELFQCISQQLSADALSLTIRFYRNIAQFCCRFR